MKKWLNGILAGLGLISVLGLTGCNLTDEQIQVIAQNAGFGSAVTWIIYDNPDTNAINLVNSTVNIVVEKANSVQTGDTYTSVICPEIEKFVVNLQPQYKFLVLTGGTAMLNGIDLLFIIHPEWKVKEGLALKVVMSFCTGAKQGLTLTNRDPVIIQARKFAENRAKVLKK